ncbi:MAG: STAS domain-containing protein [Holophaga sp.]|jgi:anti-anti-sigma factor
MAFSATLEAFDAATREARVTLKGELDASVAGQFKDVIEQAASRQPRSLTLLMTDLSFMASAGLRVLIFAKQKMGPEVPLVLVGCQEPVLNTLEMSGFSSSVQLLARL